MFLSDVNTPSERGKCKCLWIPVQASAGNTLLPFQPGKVTQLFHFVPIFPTLPHSSWPFKGLHTYFLLAAVTQSFGFPIWSVLSATLLHCVLCSCHLLFSCHYTERRSLKTRLSPCLSSSCKLVSSKHLPDTSGDKLLLPLPHYLS